ncbi:MAG TPA: DinB family protein [Phototrophicaceae bacterium]|nr:DinB family protein [Phototrophicaceae bacterium]
MNLLDRLLGHDLDTTREVLTLALALSDEQLDREFDVGWRTLRRTFSHMIGNIETWTDLMMERPTRSMTGQNSVPELLDRLERGYAEFAAFARQIEMQGRLDDLWRDVLDNPPKQKTYGGVIGHVITHDMLHRSECLHIMQRLGVNDLPEGDLMGWDTARLQGLTSDVSV